jgi:hypothetical protein
MERRQFGSVGEVPVVGQGTWNLELGERDAAIAALRREFKADVLVSVQITIPSQARPPTSEEIGFDFLGGLMASMSNEAKRAAYERMLKEGPENVAKAQKDLFRKYKAPHQPVESTTYRRNGAFLRKVQEPEWVFPGLHVKYDADTFEDTILIELESVARARAEAKRKKEAAEGKL